MFRNPRLKNPRRINADKAKLVKKWDAFQQIKDNCEITKVGERGNKLKIKKSFHDPIELTINDDAAQALVKNMAVDDNKSKKRKTRRHH